VITPQRLLGRSGCSRASIGVRWPRRSMTETTICRARTRLLPSASLGQLVGAPAIHASDEDGRVGGVGALNDEQELLPVW
jgi:hypothetical protein